MTKKKKADKYTWYHDEKMVGSILLICVAIMQVFAFLKVPVISSIHAYTIGMLFGVFNPLFYFFVGYLALKMIFQEKVHLPKWIRLNYWKYWFVFIAIIFISTSTFHYQNTTGFTAIGAKPWQSFPYWFKQFTATTPWAPAQTNGGLIGVLLYSLTASMLSGIGALILSISLLVVSVSLILTGSFIGLYKNLKNKHVLEHRSKEQAADQALNVDGYIKNVPSPKPEVKPLKSPSEERSPKAAQPAEELPSSAPTPSPESKQNVTSQNLDLPFEDPFSEK